MATLQIVNVNQSLLDGIEFNLPQTEAMERHSEQVSEINQDQDRTGFQNLGGGNTNQINIGTSMSGNERLDQFINLQGGNDTYSLYGNGYDTVYAGSGDDKVYGGIGDDTLYGGSGNDQLVGAEDNDYLNGGSGLDLLRGGSGVDQLFGGTGDDILKGGAGIDMLNGGADNDTLYGDSDGATATDSGRDTLFGGYGDDKLIGGAKADTLWGGAGKDTFIFETQSDLGYGHTDVIKDFSRTQGDKIDLRGIDANETLIFNQAFRFVDGPSDVAGDLWLGEAVNGHQRVFMNLDGVRTDLEPFQADIDLLVEFNDPTITTLTRADFML